MYHITIKIAKDSKLALQTTERSRARAVKLLCEENSLECDVVVEVQPRQVKFKGVA